MIVMTSKLRELMDELKEVNAETFYHSVRVKNLVCRMIKNLNGKGISSYTKEDIDIICKGALLHDMGKLYVYNVILTKDSSLTEEEMECMTRHTQLGFEAIEAELTEEEYETVKNICLYHHERCDGGGYEKMEGLPLYVDIVAICDVFDALNSDRIYRKKFPRDVSIEIIESGESGFFDEKMIDSLKEITEEIDL